MIDYINAITLLANYIIVPSLAYGSQLALGATYATSPLDCACWLDAKLFAVR